jgi:hypothetical protein
MIDRVTQIKVRHILRHMRWHDRVRYSGPIYMIRSNNRPSVYMGEDYEFYDPFYKDWDSEFGFIPKSKTRKRMYKIIDILHAKNPNRNFTITPYTYSHSLAVKHRR